MLVPGLAKYRELEQGNEEVLKQHRRCIVQSGNSDADDMRTEGLCGADLQGQAVNVLFSA